MIFGKSKNEILKKPQSEVFDIMRVGANISKLRKAAGITQSELADRLNVSFQAVSNWERGQSRPDIANLMELASLFDVSVDRILGSERAAKLVTDISEEKAPEMSAEEINQIAPILVDAQVDSVVRKNLLSEDEASPASKEDGGRNSEAIESLDSVPASLLPFLSDELIGELAVDAVKKGGINAIPEDWLPFVDEEYIGDIAKAAAEKDGISAIPDTLLDYVDDDILSEIAKEAAEKDGISAIPDTWLDYVDDDVLSEIAKEAAEKNGISAIPDTWLDYVDDDILSEIAKAAAEKDGISAIPEAWLDYDDEDVLTEIAVAAMEKDGFRALPEDWYPYIDEDALSEFVRKRINKSKNLNSEGENSPAGKEDGSGSGEAGEGLDSVPTPMLPFVDEDVLSKIAKEAAEKGGIKAIPYDWLDYVDEDVLTEIAVAAMEKEGFRALPEDWYPYIDEDALNEFVRKHMKKK